MTPFHGQVFTAVAYGPSPTPVSGNVVHLAWTNTPDDETGYIVGRYQVNADGTVPVLPQKSWGLGADVTAFDDTGMTPGDYRYYIWSRGANGSIDIDAHASADVVVMPPGYLEAFDGTWDNTVSTPSAFGEGGRGPTIISGFEDAYHPSTGDKDYHPGAGSSVYHKVGGSLFNGALGLDLDAIVTAALQKLSGFYKDPAHVANVPVDIIGYSRGAFEAILLADQIEDGGPNGGVPDFSTAYQDGSATKYRAYFHPKIRWVGLVSPVAQTGIVIPRKLPAGVGGGAQFNDTDPYSLLSFPPGLYPQEPITGPDGTPLPTYQPPAGQSLTHPQIGQNGQTLATMLNAANAANVPVPDAAHTPAAVLAWYGKLMDYQDQIDPPPFGYSRSRVTPTKPFSRIN